MSEVPDLTLLVTLDAVLQEGSVTGAAKRLGLSTPAVSHALARIRAQVGDPVLVRAGRTMVLTPRAEALKARVHSIVTEARQALAPEQPFVAEKLTRTFVVHASDYVLAVLGLVVDRILRDEAPGISIRFVPNTVDDPGQLTAGASDLAVGIYGDLPLAMRTRQLLTDRFVCVVRNHHPAVNKRLTLEQFVSLPQIQVAPRGRPGGYIDDVLREKGLERTVARAVPYFVTALELTAQTDYLLTIGARISEKVAPSLGIQIFDVPIPLRPYALGLVWHPRLDGDVGHRFLRDVFARAAREAAGDHHDAPRTRLDKSRRGSRPRRRMG